MGKFFKSVGGFLKKHWGKVLLAVSAGAGAAAAGAGKADAVAAAVKAVLGAQ